MAVLTKKWKMRLSVLTVAVCGSTLAFALVLSFDPATEASATSARTECYKVKSQETPFALLTPDGDAPTREETWCYRELDEPADSTLVYHVDENGRSSPELSVIVESDGAIVHTSLLKGVRTVHRLKSNYNPLPIPLTPPDDAERVAVPISPSSIHTSNHALKVLTTSPIQTNDIAIRRDGKYHVSVAQESLPWRGYWYPHSSGRLHSGSNSPMAKFDAIVKKRTGIHPGAQSWERNNHAYTGINWAGHCNGWAAAAVLRKEPQKPWTDPISGVTFSVADIKGILMERDYCPKYLFFGRRYRGGGGLSDISAEDFHNTITYYIGRLNKPLLMDYMRTEPVENRVVSGYVMDIEPLGNRSYRVTTTLTVHSYDAGITDALGVAADIKRDYKYEVWTNDKGQIESARWLSTNPDFFWIPIEPGDCKDKNPAITEAWIKAINAPIALPGW